MDFISLNWWWGIKPIAENYWWQNKIIRLPSGDTRLAPEGNQLLEMMATKTIWLLATAFMILSCKNKELTTMDTLLEKQEQKQVTNLLNSLPRPFIDSQKEMLAQLYKESQPLSNVAAVKSLAVYQQILSGFKENGLQSWALLFSEIAAKNSVNKANASVLLYDLAFPRYEFILEDLKREDIRATELTIVQRLLRLETFGGPLKDPSL